MPQARAWLLPLDAWRPHWPRLARRKAHWRHGSVPQATGAGVALALFIALGIPAGTARALFRHAGSAPADLTVRQIDGSPWKAYAAFVPALAGGDTIAAADPSGRPLAVCVIDDSAYPICRPEPPR